jgi:hypothetical protein
VDRLISVLAQQARSREISRVHAQDNHVGLSRGCTKGKWLDKLSHSHILANAYTRPIIFLSITQSTTFLPLCLGPEDSVNIEPIYMVHMINNHWILANIKAANGIKPIPPPFLVPNSNSESAKNWLTLLQKGCELYNQDFNA